MIDRRFFHASGESRKGEYPFLTSPGTSGSDLKKSIMLLFISFAAFHLWSQEDSILLDDLVVSGFRLPDYATGSDAQAIAITSSGSLSDLLGAATGMYFKTYGNQQLSTISFRGTGASHTNVLWHGLPVNSPVLGQTDFSLWPVWQMDNIAIQPGSSGALYGSGSIGGAVFIDHFGDAIVDQGAQLKLEIGSFGKLFTGAKGTYGSRKFSGKTSLYRDFIQNDFSYPLKGTSETQTQNNARVYSYGAKQRLQWHQGIHRISGELLFNQNDRQIQPPITNQNSNDQLETTNFRTAVEHEADLPIGLFTTTFGYMHDKYTFNLSDKTKTEQYSLLTHYSHDFERLSMLAGALLNSANAQSASYQGTPVQQRAELFGSINWFVHSQWTLSAALRQNLIQGVNAPFTPTIGSELKFGQMDGSSWLWRIQVSRGFRFPTLNDLYWNPGGNPELLPETSWNVESGLDFAHQYSNHTFSAGLNLYAIWAEKWIIWTPASDGIWSPENLQNVRVLGLEYRMNHVLVGPNGSLQNDISLGSQISQNQSDFPSKSANGNQLPYVPFISSNWNTAWKISNWNLNIQQHFTGKRFATLDNSPYQSIDGYYLLNLGAGYNWNFWSSSINCGFSVNNILNSYYENLLNRAMPGINYQLHLHYNL